MKTLITVISAMLLTLGVVSEAHAKRFGSGGFGKSFPTQQRSAPAKQSDKTSGNAQAAPSRGGMMGGMMGGLLAGGLFAYLLGSGAFEGIQIMDILLLGLAAFVIIRLLRGAGQAQQRQTAAAAHGPAAHQSFQSLNETASSAVAPDQPVTLPADFDADAFTQGALEHYRLVQQAWNDGNLDLIREYVSPELYDALAAQRNRLMVPPKTEILDLEAEIIRADETSTHREISVLFRGRCKDDLEKSEDGIFDVWHLERDLRDDNSPWLVVGIEAE